ncbi:MAG TPA: ABC transporter permease [Vicinamibacterales bacterium]|nr:ABC transporter permease [Vicinamibacterales bacterium]
MRFRQILRRLWQFPAFTSVAVLTLGIGIGANAAVFSIVDGVLLKPLPYFNADELIAISHDALGLNLKNSGSAAFLTFTYVDQARTFDRIGLWRTSTSSVTGVGDPEEVRTIEVTEGAIRALGIAARLGRTFTPEDDAPGSPESVILMAGYWRTKFGADPNVIGKRIVLDGRARNIIGVMPDSFSFLDRPATMILPVRLDRQQTRLGGFNFQSIARLKPGATIEQATADAVRLVPVAMRAFPTPLGASLALFESARVTPVITPLKEAVIGDVGSVLWVLMGTIGLVLLIACANVANLLLVRADGRQQELAIRAALGAGRGRLALEMLAESVTLGVLGGAAALALAYGALRVMLWLAPPNLPRMSSIAIDWRVVAFTIAASIAAGLLFGSVPVIRYARASTVNAIRGGGRTQSAGRERHFARNSLVVVQVALALMLLVGSGLMIRTFQALRHVQPGFAAPEQVQTFRVSIPRAQVREEVAVVRMTQALADRIAAIPGVTAIAMTSNVPMTSSGWHDPIFTADQPGSDKLPPIRTFRFVSPGFFATMGTRIVAGRDFSWSDLYEDHNVAMVSESLARELWDEPSAALGKQVREALNSPWRDVVGIAADVREDGVDRKAPTVVYWPMLMAGFQQAPHWAQRSAAFVVRSTRTGSSGFAGEISQAVWSVNPNLPLANVRILQEIYETSMARTSFALVLLAVAGGMALLLGLAGIYAVISYAVAQRTREIGIRIALGARSSEVTRLFVGYGATLAAIGVVIGLAAALVAGRVIRTMLFEVSPMDPATYAAVAATLLAVAAFASYLPAVRISAIDPVEALRAE